MNADPGGWSAASEAVSADAEIAHHAVLLVLDDVTMKHPVAGIVGDKGYFGYLVGQQEQGVSMVFGPAQFVRADQLEGMAVNMDGVSKG